MPNDVTGESPTKRAPRAKPAPEPALPGLELPGLDDRMIAAAGEALDRIAAVERKLAEPTMNSLYPKLLAIAEAVESVPKLGFNAHDNYHYVREPDMLAAAKKAMIEAKVIRVPVRYTVEESQNAAAKIGAKECKATIDSRWVDVETGDFLDVHIEGFDVNGGNKASWAAYTGCLKYELRHLCLVDTGDDPERISDNSERGAKRNDDRRVSGSAHAAAGPAGTGFSRSAPAGQPASAEAPLTKEDFEFLERWVKAHDQLLPYYNTYGAKFAIGDAEEPGLLTQYLREGPGLKVRARRMQKAREVWGETTARFMAENPKDGQA